METNLVSLTMQIDARRKRQALAHAATAAVVIELETALRSIDSKQVDLVEAANKDFDSRQPGVRRPK